MKQTAWIAVAVVLVLALALALPALSQPGGEGGPPGMMGGPGGPGMGGPPMGGPAAPTVILGEKGLYVVTGQQVLRLDPETLKVLAKAELPRPEPPAGVPAAGHANKQQ